MVVFDDRAGYFIDTEMVFANVLAFRRRFAVPGKFAIVLA